jgi:hypothetical protein
MEIVLYHDFVNAIFSDKPGFVCYSEDKYGLSHLLVRVLFTMRVSLYAL